MPCLIIKLICYHSTKFSTACFAFACRTIVCVCPTGVSMCKFYLYVCTFIQRFTSLSWPTQPSLKSRNLDDRGDVSWLPEGFRIGHTNICSMCMCLFVSDVLALGSWFTFARPRVSTPGKQQVIVFLKVCTELRESWLLMSSLVSAQTTDTRIDCSIFKTLFSINSWLANK